MATDQSQLTVWVDRTARNAVLKIMENLAERKGILDDLDDEVRREITDSFESIVSGTLRMDLMRRDAPPVGECDDPIGATEGPETGYAGVPQQLSGKAPVSEYIPTEVDVTDEEISEPEATEGGGPDSGPGA